MCFFCWIFFTSFVLQCSLNMWENLQRKNGPGTTLPPYLKLVQKLIWFWLTLPFSWYDITIIIEIPSIHTLYIGRSWGWKFFWNIPLKFYCSVNVILILSFGKTWIIFLSSQFTSRWLQRMSFHQVIFKTVWIDFRSGGALCVYLHLFCTKPLFCISGNILPLIVFRYSIWGTLQKKFHYIKGEKSNILVNLFLMCHDLCKKENI